VPEAVALDVLSTTAGGYISGLVPQACLRSAFATVAGGAPVEVPTESGRVAERFVLVVSTMPSVADDGTADDCDCAAPSLPRVPDAADLATDVSTFAADRGRCVDFTVPNRTIEEVAFQAVVRTTQPDLRGTPTTFGTRVPQHVLNELHSLALAGADDVSRHTALGPAGASAPQTSGDNGPVTRLRDTSPTRFALGTATRVTRVAPELERLRLDSAVSDQASKRIAATFGLVDIEETAALEPHIMAALALATRGRDAVLRLEDGVASELARESSTLTPLRLLRAEQVSALRRFRQAVTVLAAPNPPRFVPDADHQADWDSLPLALQATTISHGHLLTFKQVWNADGYSLGDLLYSLPLAPGQRKLVSTLDWDRRDVARRTASRREEERLDAALVHDRDISDVISSALSERMDASSSADTWAVGGGIGAFIGPLVIGAAGGVSGASSTANQTSARSVTGSALNQVRDRTLQAASAVRSQRSTVVQSSSQGESVRAQTEVVANYNHCHAMTVEYFEVLRHFQVRQEIAQVQECLFIPFAITPFTREKAQRWRDALTGAVSLRHRRAQFASLERVVTNWATSDVPLARYADDVLRQLDGELVLRMTLPRPADEDDHSFRAESWTTWAPYLNGTPRQVWDRYIGATTHSRRDAAWASLVAPGIALRIVEGFGLALVNGALADAAPVDLTLVSGFAQDRAMTMTLRVVPGGLGSRTRSAVTALRLSAPADLPLGARLRIERASFRYRTDHLSRDLVSDRRVLNDLAIGDEVEMSTPLDAVEKRNPRFSDARAAENLVDHLNEHIEHYHRVIWQAMHPNRRFLLLDGFEAPDAGGRSVASVVENRVIGIVGNSLVMPVVPGTRLDPTYKFAKSDQGDLLQLYTGDAVPPMRISVPTKGVFAEAVLGKCNSCESINDAVFWRFEDEPIPDVPTSIEALSLASRRRAVPSLAADQFPDPLVAMQALPSAPDPTGLAAAIKTLGTNGIFKDITGLALNQANASAALKSAIGAAQGFATQAGALAQQRFLNGELDRSLDKIKGARDKGLITEADAQKLSEQVLRGAIGEVRPKETPPTGTASVQKAMERVTTAANGGSLKVTRPDGSVEVKTGKARKVGIDVHVDPPVGPIAQPTNMVCWAAAGTMMLAWLRRRSMTIETALDGLGGNWRALFDTNSGLTAAQLRGFVQAVGLSEEGPASFTPEGLARLVSAHGPLFVVGDDTIVDNFVTHLRIVTGVVGDGTSDRTQVEVVDPATGTEQTLRFTAFASNLEAGDVVNFGAGILHF
jgi:hypothetical protein